MFSGELRDSEVLVLDCQSTGATPEHGHLLELGWARARASRGASRVHARLVALPEGETVPGRVAKITGIGEEDLAEAVEPQTAWSHLLDDAARIASRTGDRPAAVVHFARFERAFLSELHDRCGNDGEFPFEWVCTHAIARRLLPELPRRGLRALAGYFGFSVAQLRRSADHVEATAFVWRRLVELLEARGIRTLAELRAWLAETEPPAAERVYPMPRETRLALPDRPGVYRMLRDNGDLLYVGKATSLRRRVNSYFHKRARVADRTLEMLTQARDLSVTVTETALEAALLEADEIKRTRPPYNVALVEGARGTWFGAGGVGPLPRKDSLEAFEALAAGGAVDAAVLGVAEDVPCFGEGLAVFRERHGELGRRGLLALGARLWAEAREREREREREGEREREREGEREWDPDRVARWLERIARHGAVVLRRARWLCGLTEATLVWREVGHPTRLLVIARGEIQQCATVAPGFVPPAPAARAWADRRRCFARSSRTYDRLRVLTTELRKLVVEAERVDVRLGRSRLLSRERLASTLSWL